MNAVAKIQDKLGNPDLIADARLDARPADTHT
jgi:hypothetical protein